MLILNIENIPTSEIEKYLGVVDSQVVIGANIFRDVFASFRDVFGGVSKSYQRELEQLNNHNPFDFNYKPRNRDLLTLKFEEGEFNLFYYTKRWTDFDEYEDLEENQKEEIQKGFLKGGLNSKITKSIKS